MEFSNIEYSALSDLYNSMSAKMTKSLMSLKANDIIKAEITDITPDSVKLKLADNSVINARSLVIPDAKIGQTAHFIVKSNINGQIAIEFLKENSSNVPESLVKNILNSFNIPVVKQNTEIIAALLENNIEINEENVNKALFFRYSLPEGSVQDTIFLLKENMPPTPQTIEIFKNIIENPGYFKDMILNLANEIVNMPESEEKIAVLKSFEIYVKSDELYSKEKRNDVFNKIVNKLFVNDKLLKNSNEIMVKLEQIRKTISSMENTEDIKVQNAVKELKNTADFIKNIDVTKMYLQIPVIINGKKECCEFYVFNNGRNKTAKSETVRVLLSLNTVNLGKTEIYIEKNMNNLSFKFRLENQDTQHLIKKNIKTLSLLLKSKKLNLVSVSYMGKDEKFEIQKKEKEPKQRYSFDMHV